MNQYQNPLSSFPTNPNGSIPKLLVGTGGLNVKPKKKVTFKETVTFFNVENYKELNKTLCYDEKEGLKEYYKSLPYGANPHNYYDYKSLYEKNKTNTKTTTNTTYTGIKKENNNECCKVF